MVPGYCLPSHSSLILPSSPGRCCRRLFQTLNLTESHPGGFSSSALVIPPTAALSLHRRGDASR